MIDSTSLIDASSQAGLNGTVRVQSPISQAGGKIVPLSKSTLEVNALLSQRCAAAASGQHSSFVLTGRETLPAEPGRWLMSPLLASDDESASGPEVVHRRTTMEEEIRSAPRNASAGTAGTTGSTTFGTMKAGCAS